MKIGIMQPYFFPYIGYFQLINAVDTFVILDDVNYKKKGWINRNRILINNTEHLFSIPLKEASQNKLICNISIVEDNKWQEKLLRSIEFAYKKAPFFKNVFPIIEEIILNDEKKLAKYLEFSLRKINSYLKINNSILVSSDLNKNNKLKAQEKVIEICKKLNGTVYINAIGGLELYSKERFAEDNLELRFIKSTSSPYKQFDNMFVPDLYIVDVMMFNSVEDIQEMLNQYELL